MQKAQAVHEHQPQWANGALDEHQSSQRSLSHTPFTGRVDVVKLRTNRVRLACMCLWVHELILVFPSRFRNRHAIDTAQNQKHTQGLGPAPHASRAHTHAQWHRQQPSKGSKHQIKHLCEVTLCLVVQGGTSTASSTGSVTGRRLSTHDGACVAARWQEPQVSHSRLNRAGARFRAA